MNDNVHLELPTTQISCFKDSKTDTSSFLAGFFLQTEYVAGGGWVFTGSPGRRRLGLHRICGRRRLGLHRIPWQKAGSSPDPMATVLSNFRIPMEPCTVPADVLSVDSSGSVSALQLPLPPTFPGPRRPRDRSLVDVKLTGLPFDPSPLRAPGHS